MPNQVGIRAITMCDKGTGATTPTNAWGFGTRNNEELKYKDVSDNDVRNRPLLYKGRFETPSIETRQPNLAMLEDLFKTYRAVEGADVEFLCEPKSSGVDNGAFQFFGSNCMGYQARAEYTPKKRIIGVQFGVALPQLTAKAIWDASDSNTVMSAGITNLGIDPTKERFPWHAITASTIKPGSTYDALDLLDYSLILEEVEAGSKDEIAERFIQGYIRATLMFKINGAEVAKVVADMAETQGVAISMQHDTSLSSATFEKFVFNQYVLRKTREVTINNKERHIVQTYVGEFPRGNMAFSYTTLNGGGSSADGSEGGTVTVSL